MEIVGEYSDEGHSGKNIKGRPEFMKMLNDIEDSEIERACAEAKEKQQEQAKEQSQKQGKEQSQDKDGFMKASGELLPFR